MTARRAVQRPFDLAPVPVPPACAGLPDRDTESTAPPRTACAARVANVQWGLTCTGPWTERRTCPRTFQRRLFVGRLPGSSACACFRHADDVPLLGDQRAPVVIGAVTCLGTSPTHARRTDQDPRSSASPRRLPAPDGSGCLPPLRPRIRERIAPFRVPRRPPAHAAHTPLPWLGPTCVSRGIASVTEGEPAVTSREQVAFVTSLVRSLSRARAWA